MSAFHRPVVRAKTPVWNKCRIIGQKRPLLPNHVWAIRVRLWQRDKQPLMTASAFLFDLTKSGLTKLAAAARAHIEYL